MIVLDASVGIEILLQSPVGRSYVERFLDPGTIPCVPHLFTAEVAQVLRRYWLRGEIDERWAARALEDLRDLPIERFSHELLLPRAWELKNNVTIYDAVYVALAELLDAPLVTLDRRLAASSGHTATIKVL